MIWVCVNANNFSIFFLFIYLFIYFFLGGGGGVLEVGGVLEGGGGSLISLSVHVV